MDENDRPAPPPGLRTRAVHAGTDAAQPFGSLTAPIVQTATYTFANTAELAAHMRGEVERLEYGRYGNPTQRAAEEKLAALDGAGDALLCASGMAAITTTLLALLRAGQHVVLTDDGYRRTRQLCRQVLARLGIEVSVVPADTAAIVAALRPETRVVMTESPTNPYLQIADIPALAAALAGHPAKLVVDATFATPVNQRPLAQGADLVIHSATKYLGGHNDLLAGVIAGPAPLVGAIRELQGVLGAVPDPHAAWLLVRGLKTLPLRVAAQNESALRVASALERHPRVARVWYPGLASHPQHALARELMTGFGGVVTFALDADLDATSRFIDAVRIFRIAPSLGGVEALIEQVALMSYFELTTEERLAIGIRDSLVRLSVGLEDPEDLERALLDALDTSA
ncbi:MAG: aminotransferase class I/II-fold pyridoxal phosphate-dependent enzyme [Myxococcales bacterium]|nr:aminotransferase class I/II-fold pyridoxal phosphate-dependent enzyme [Myxococcales bacterium]MCB9732736.1 aminotransferase class I/II-fold pyridoxal phosphate-dependent enzyme [Deltaproteobacteria bacterium]